MQDGRWAGIEENGMEGGVGSYSVLNGTGCAVVDDSLDGDDHENAGSVVDGRPRTMNGRHNGIGENGKQMDNEYLSRRTQVEEVDSDLHPETNAHLVTDAEERDVKVVNGAEKSDSSAPMALPHESRDVLRGKAEVVDGIVIPARVPLERTTGQNGDDGDGDTEDRTQARLSNVPRRSERASSPSRDKDGRILKLSPAKIHELTSSPESVCLRAIPGDRDRSQTIASPRPVLPPSAYDYRDGAELTKGDEMNGMPTVNGGGRQTLKRRKSGGWKNVRLDGSPDFLGQAKTTPSGRRTHQKSRAASSPGSSHRPKTSPGFADRQPPTSNPSLPKRGGRGRAASRLHLEGEKASQDPSAAGPSHLPSPVPMSVPLPPFSLPTYLQLELSSERPSPLYIHQSATQDFPYESSQVKLERLQNFLLLPPLLERVLWFGTLACLDSWLYSFTIFPLRFGKSIAILWQSWFTNLGVETRYISRFVVAGVGRVWRRRRWRGSRVSSISVSNGQPSGPESAKSATSSAASNSTDKPNISVPEREVKDNVDGGRRRRASTIRYHRRTKSVPSSLMPDDKADILKGLLMISTCITLMYFDASRVYHWIRGQAAIKLYVIYNVLEVGDRLFSAIGQDVLECLFSREALERKPDGRSKVLRPFWLFILALIYNVIHSTALFYQVMTLNVAVNSYSNALITLLLSNQFVEIKSTVFKKFEKENLFQLTCADVVERFQLWLMLLIIACRNLVETGAFSFGNALTAFAGTSPSSSTNSTPPSTTSILPQSFTMLPSAVFSSLNSVNSFLPTVGQVLGPFLVVLGSEMLVDWVKHAYINKFNNCRPSIYGRFLDILAKDYYTNAFGEQNLNRRLGLPIIPLSCLFFRVSVQTYQMFLTSWLPRSPSPFPPSNTTSLSSIHSHYSPSVSSPSESPYPSASAFSYLLPSAPTSLNQISSLFKSLISHAMPSPAAFVPIFTVILILLLYVTLLLAKLVLGMVLLSYARARYKSMKSREKQVYSSTAGTSSANADPSSTSHKNIPHHLQPQQQRQSVSNSQSAVSPSSPAVHHTSTHNSKDATSRGAPDDFVVEGSRRVGGWGAVEIGDERRSWIYADDPEGLRAVQERDERAKAGNNNNAKGGGKAASAGAMGGIEGVRRYEMVGKRIW